ncbi:hypothetical protein VTN00DRAFT_4282 [Thermoascus crustaceus]|uniref:uncharacterized protein n=1 Tax=Thermoascus crustaceus TaxID=5088 RepID=UPI003742C227
MLVPKAFLFGSAPPKKTSRQEVRDRPSTQRRCSEKAQGISCFQFPDMATADVTHTEPVFIPPKRAPRRMPVTPVTNNSGRSPRKGPSTGRRSPSMAVREGSVPPSIATLLEVTSIPRQQRSRSVRSSRRLPPGDHVEDFSRLLMEGIESEKHGPMIDGPGNTALDLLLSPPDQDNEKSMFENDYVPGTPRSIRSMSTDSTAPSLDNEPESYTPSSDVPATPTSSGQRSPLERRYRQLSPSEDSSAAHPLMETEDDSIDQFFGSSDAASLKSPSSTRPFPRLGSTFKSNLTASLRAIKSAAQTVSNFATPSVHSDDFLTRSLFMITPKLTDDRRPLPMDEPPSPALRRYLNPITASPAEMHVYHEHPHDRTNTSNACPVSIQMQTYHRSGRNGSKKSGFSVNSSGEKAQRFFDPEMPPMTRQREPRENSDFLRMVVLEMNMRRSGKLRDDIPARARVWLPPRKMNPSRLSSSNFYDDDDADDGPVPQRWIGISVECL